MATVLLLVGFYFIKRGRVEAHKRTMLTAFGVSAAFLACYLWYHSQVGQRVDSRSPARCGIVYLRDPRVARSCWRSPCRFWRSRRSTSAYRALGCCPSAVHQAEQLVEAAAYREKHIRLARWTFPIWLYVSVTGVVVYVMLYHLWPPAGQ